MIDALFWHRAQFAFTITFHYLFPQLTMGLALLILIFKLIGLKPGKENYSECARFWARIFGINFAMGVVTGIPLEFQFGTNWARFSSYSGGVIGQTLAMEGVFAFFLESTFLGLFLFGEKRLGRIGHLAAAAALCFGSWLSGYFIIATNAFMQNPVAYSQGPNHDLQLASFWGLLSNPWAIWQYLHNMTASVITACFVVSAIGAYWALIDSHERHAQACLKIGVILGFFACMIVIFPTGDRQGKMLTQQQPVTLAAVEGLFHADKGAPLAIIGQPDVKNERLENPIVFPGVLSFLTYGTFGSTVKGLDDFPRDQWPRNIELVYYAYHIMAGLGTMFVTLMATAMFLLIRGQLFESRKILWTLMLAAPFPYIATTAGWWTAELGRQPWLIQGLMRTADGYSSSVNPGDVVFTLLGFMGLYLLLGFLFMFLVVREFGQGPAQVFAPKPTETLGETEILSPPKF